MVQVCGVVGFCWPTSASTPPLTYARAHDQTVVEDYYLVMEAVEKRLQLVGVPVEKDELVTENERRRILDLTTKLAEPELSPKARLVLAAQIRMVLLGEMKVSSNGISAVRTSPSVLLEHPPPSRVHCVTA